MRQPSSTAEQVIGRLAVSAWGVVKRARLLAAGVTPAEIRHRLSTGALLREYPGVYRVGHRAPSLEASYLAAVWACGERAVLCGHAAAHLYGLVKGLAPPPEVATRTWRRVAGVRARRLRVDPLDATRWRSIPVTTVARTLVDLAGVLSEDALARACHEAEVRSRTTPAEVEAVLARWPNAPGSGKLRAILRGEARVTLSEPEKRFLALLREAGLPLPQTNAPPAPATWTAAGRSSGSPSSSTATAITTRATPGSRIASASARRAPAATTSAASPTATSTSARRR